MRELPRHVAVVIDGNGRWAEQRGLPRLAGHHAGRAAVRRLVEAAGELGIAYLTLYAFSTENWRRPHAEVRGLMVLYEEVLAAELSALIAHRVRLRFMGERAGLPPSLLAKMDRAEASTQDHRGLCLIVALNYGGRQEMVRAAQRFAQAVQKGELEPASLDPERWRQFLYLPDVPDPDLLIRTSGETRLSNFLLYQAAYTELYFTPKFWPDFSRADLEAALESYAARRRRYGGLGGRAAP